MTRHMFAGLALVLGAVTIAPGADFFDPLTALEQWVEHGKAPDTMVATNRTAGIERPVCAWPTLPYYRSGDPSKAGNFVCR